jgi:putative ABC transport system permease protein
LRTRDRLDLAVQTLRGHPLRTALTTLGMVIGVASVVSMTSLGLGAREQVATEIERLGTNLLAVQPLASAAATHGMSESGRRLTEQDGIALGRELADVTLVAPIVTTQVGLVLGNKNRRVSVIGTSPNYLDARDWWVETGRHFTDREVAASANVVLLGHTVARALSPHSSVVGLIIRIEDLPFRVVGVLAEKGSATGGGDQDDVAIAPIDTVRSRLIGGYFRERPDAAGLLLVKGSGPDAMPALRSDVRRVLRARHGLREADRDDFRIGDPLAALSASKSTSETLTWWLGCIAGVSLVVGGISIMNIMLVSVAERTREIAIRITMGATERDIRWQLLLESAGIALAGGFIGAALGVAAGVIASRLLGWPIAINVWICLAALSFSAFVGLAAGLYPARLGALLDPWAAIQQR